MINIYLKRCIKRFPAELENGRKIYSELFLGVNFPLLHQAVFALDRNFGFYKSVASRP